jgi:hypothetical protein
MGRRPPQLINRQSYRAIPSGGSELQIGFRFMPAIRPATEATMASSSGLGGLGCVAGRSRRGLVRGCDDYPRARDGVVPVSFRNARVKALWS